jgi:hypothetical protein
MLGPWSLKVVFLSVLSRSAAQSQYLLDFNHHEPSEKVAPADLTESFNSNPLPPPAIDSWFGLTTFAHSYPLRCLGADESRRYDVAILGMFNGARLTYTL